MDVETDDATVSPAEVFRVGGILQGEKAEESMGGLFVEVERAKADCEKVFVSWAPLEGCHLKTSSCLKHELPER